jgi:hypothetical protein
LLFTAAVMAESVMLCLSQFALASARNPPRTINRIRVALLTKSVFKLRFLLMTIHFKQGPIREWAGSDLKGDGAKGAFARSLRAF